MTSIKLHVSTGAEHIDTILVGIVNLYEMTFPGRIRSYYVTGSYAYGDPVSGSDIDGMIIFKDNFIDTAERDKAWNLGWYCRQLSSHKLDILVTGEIRVLRLGNPDVKLGGLLIYGEDIRNHIKLPPIDFYAPMMMHVPVSFFGEPRGKPDTLTYPLDYPNPQGEFFGYDSRRTQMLDGTWKPNTKALVNCISKVTLAQASLATRTHIRHKPDCLEKYKRYVDDGWNGFVDRVYARCRKDWGYLIPDNPDGRLELQQLCQQTLEFENHYLTRYRSFLLETVQSEPKTDTWIAVADAIDLLGFSQDLLQQAITSGAIETKTIGNTLLVSGEVLLQIQAAKMLAKVIYPNDTAIVDALSRHLNSENIYLQHMVEVALKSITEALT